MCELLHTGDVFWPSSGDPPPRGTDGSNPSPSSEESIANLISALRWGTAGAGERFSTMLACETSREIIKRLVSLTPALVSSAIQTTGF